MEVKQVMQVMQIMQVMQVMQVMQAVKLISESIRHWEFLDALASLDLKLSLSQWFTVFQIISNSSNASNASNGSNPSNAGNASNASSKVSQQVNQSLNMFSALTNNNCYRCINSTQWLLFICFKRFTFEWQCCKSNHWIKVLTLTLRVIPNQIILHMCYFHSVAPRLKQCQIKPNIPPCRLCKFNDSINILYMTIPNQIILHTCYSSHCNQII